MFGCVFLKSILVFRIDFEINKFFLFYVIITFRGIVKYKLFYLKINFN